MDLWGHPFQFDQQKLNSPLDSQLLRKKYGEGFFAIIALFSSVRLFSPLSILQ